jgi:hypothetical protein
MGRLMSLIIGCHGHFTTEPPQHHAFPIAQIAFATGEVSGRPDIDNAEIAKRNIDKLTLRPDE